MKRRMAYAFDLDGTVTKEEILPMIADELGLLREMKLLTQLTINGTIGFEDSFRLRFQILKSVPIVDIHNVVKAVTIDSNINRFIRENSSDCYIITGNLDLWIEPLVSRIDCRFYSSMAEVLDNGDYKLGSILLKSAAIREIHESYESVTVIGESYNDLSMFEEADIGIAYGGVHHPVPDIVRIANYVCYEGGSLCRLLSTL